MSGSTLAAIGATGLGAARLGLAGCAARLRHAKSASAAAGSAGAFVVLAALLSFVPDAAPDRTAPHRSVAEGSGRDAGWALRGTLPAEPATVAARRPPDDGPAGLQALAKRV